MNADRGGRAGWTWRSELAVKRMKMMCEVRSQRRCWRIEGDNTNDERLAADGEEEYKKNDGGRYH